MAYICHESFQSDWICWPELRNTQPIGLHFIALNNDNLISCVWISEAFRKEDKMLAIENHLSMGCKWFVVIFNGFTKL